MFPPLHIEERASGSNGHSRIADWVVLAAALAGAAAIALRRPLRLLLVLLFPLAVYFSFRSLRDQWIVLVVGLSLVASASRGLPIAPTRLTLAPDWRWPPRWPYWRRPPS